MVHTWLNGTHNGTHTLSITPQQRLGSAAQFNVFTIQVIEVDKSFTCRNIMIIRVRGKYIGRNAASAYKDLMWTVATALDTTLDIEVQTERHSRSWIKGQKIITQCRIHMF